MGIIYTADRVVAVHEFSDLLRRSTLAERRPVEDAACLAAMLRHANLIVTAWDGDVLVGIARALTDFAYCCYLADLAVDAACQHRGIGRELIRQVQAKLGDRAKIILLAAPKAEGYYPKLGFERHGSAWIVSARATLN